MSFTVSRHFPGDSPACVALARIRVRETAMNSAAGMPLPATSAITMPIRFSSSAKKS